MICSFLLNVIKTEFDMKKNYEELKRFLQSEEQVLKEQKYYHVSKMQL